MLRPVLVVLLVALAAPVHAQPEPAPPAVPVEEPGGRARERLDDLLKPNFRIRGLIETDAVLASQSAASMAQIGDLQNGYGFRRVRLGARGTIGDSTRWVSEVELAGGRVQSVDVFVGFTAVPVVREVRVGYFREPFSLEAATGVPALTFRERSPLNDLDPARNWGLAGYWWPETERALLALGVYRDGTANSGQSTGDQGAWAVTGRATGLPVYDPDDDAFRLVHVGGALSYRVPNNGLVVYSLGPSGNLLQVEDNPGTPFLPVIQIPATSQQLYNLQAAGVYGSLSVQAEWFGSAVQQPTAGVVFLHGSYAYVSYFVTGEHRGYDRTRGAFGPVKVRRPVTRAPGSLTGPGAIELGSRFSYLNFNSPNITSTPANPAIREVLYQYDAEVNWYVNDSTRVMLSYTAAFPALAGGSAIAAHVFGHRVGLYW